MNFKHVLVGTDFQECTEAAVAYAVEIASHYGASLTVVHAFELPYSYEVLDIDELLEASEQAAATKLDEVLEKVRTRVPAATGIVRSGVPWEEILAVARQQAADLIVMGTHGRKGLPHALLGSVAEKVVRLSPVPVLTVRGRP